MEQFNVISEGRRASVKALMGRAGYWVPPSGGVCGSRGVLCKLWGGVSEVAHCWPPRAAQGRGRKRRKAGFEECSYWWMLLSRSVLLPSKYRVMESVYPPSSMVVKKTTVGLWVFPGLSFPISQVKILIWSITVGYGGVWRKGRWHSGTLWVSYCVVTDNLVFILEESVFIWRQPGLIGL
jgi:hypothetical protein